MADRLQETKQLDKFLCIFLPLLSLPALLTTIYPGYEVNSWQITEWLINYQGGFVRRGLPGEIILALSRQGINPYLLIVGLSFSIWLILFVVLLKLSVHKGFPPIIICSQLFMLAPVIGHQMVRKDCLTILLFTIALYFLQKRRLRSIFLANGISGIAVLSHEIYGFISIPMFFIVKYTEQHHAANASSTGSCHRRFIYAVACNAPLLALFALCIAYKGSPAVTLAIWRSWQDHGLLLTEFYPDNAIEALGWSVKVLIMTLLNDSLGIFFVWIATAALVAFYLLLLYRSHLITLQVADEKAEEQLSCLARILLGQFLLFFPATVMADHGRWIFLWAASSISLFLVLSRARLLAFSSLVPHAVSILPSTARHALRIFRCAYAYPLAYAFGSSRRLAFAKLSLLLFAIPVCCWSVVSYLSYTPLGQPFYYSMAAVYVLWSPHGPALLR